MGVCDGRALAQHPGSSASSTTATQKKEEEMTDLPQGIFKLDIWMGGFTVRTSSWLNVAGSFNHISLESFPCFPQWGHGISQKESRY